MVTLNLPHLAGVFLVPYWMSFVHWIYSLCLTNTTVKLQINTASAISMALIYVGRAAEATGGVVSCPGRIAEVDSHSFLTSQDTLRLITSVPGVARIEIFSEPFGLCCLLHHSRLGILWQLTSAVLQFAPLSFLCDAA